MTFRNRVGLTSAGGCCCPTLMTINQNVINNDINSPCGATSPFNFDAIVANRASVNPLGFGTRNISVISPASPTYTPTIDDYTGVYLRYNGNPITRPRNYLGNNFLNGGAENIADRTFNNNCNLAARFTNNDLRGYRAVDPNGRMRMYPPVFCDRPCDPCNPYSQSDIPYASELPYGATIPTQLDYPYGAGSIYSRGSQCNIAPVPSIYNYGPPTTFDPYNGNVQAIPIGPYGTTEPNICNPGAYRPDLFYPDRYRMDPNRLDNPRTYWNRLYC